MKKIWFLMLMMCAVLTTFTACSDSDDDGGNAVPSLPIAGVNIPSSAKIGDEVIIQGTGFVAGGELYLEDNAGAQTKVDATFSNAGATFAVPYSLATGTYKVVWKQEGSSWTLGSLTLTESDNPILNISLPEQAVPGKEVVFIGIGYKEGDQVKLTADGATDVVIEDIQFPADGLTFILPADCAEGTYTAYLVRGSSSWSLGTLKVEMARRIKSIVAEAAVYGSLNFALSYDNEGRLTSIIDEEDGYNWEFTYNGNEVSCPAGLYGMPLTFTMENGKVTKSMALEPLMDGEELYNNWSYTDNDYLASVTNESEDYETYWGGYNMTLTYSSDGNLENFNFGGDYKFAYDKSTVQSVPNTLEPAVAVCLMQVVMGKEDAFCAFLLNQNVKASKLVPSSITMSSDDGDMTFDITATKKDDTLSLTFSDDQAGMAGLANVTITYEAAE